MEGTWLGLDEARNKALEIDEAPDEAPDEVLRGGRGSSGRRSRLGSRMKFQVRGLALVGMLVVMSLHFSSCNNGDKEWEDAPGTKSKMNVGSWFEGTWSGGPWGELVLRSEGDDSVFGSSDDGALSIMGRVSRYRIDMKLLSHDHEETSGYLYHIPGTDSLHVGIRGTEGEWESFFSLARTHPDANQRRSAK